MLFPDEKPVPARPFLSARIHRKGTFQKKP
jgi:hypothetical protein